MGFVKSMCTLTSPQCHSTTLSKEGCRVDLDATPESRLILDLDRDGSPIPTTETRCDYLLFADGTCDQSWLVPLELKGGGFRASKVVAQLQAGVRAADELIPPGIKPQFRPTLAFGGGVRRAELDSLKAPNSRLHFRGKREFVRLIRCGSGLNGVFKQDPRRLGSQSGSRRSSQRQKRRGDRP